MYRIEGTIQLVSPLLFNRPDIETIRKADEGAGGGKMTRKQKEDEAMGRLHRCGAAPLTLPAGYVWVAGHICVPSHNFKRCLVGGVNSAGLKFGRKALAPYIDATVFPAHDLSFGTDAPDEIFEHWGRIPPKTGGLVLLRRPLMKAGRELDFALDVFDDRRDEKQVRVGLEQAGLYIGLGAWRPTYGRFLVTRWEVISGRQPVAPVLPAKKAAGSARRDQA